MAKSLGLQAPCVDIALSVVPGAKGQLFGVKFSLSRRCDNPMARRCAIERASAPRVCALSMVCLRAMGLQRRREKDHAPLEKDPFGCCGNSGQDLVRTWRKKTKHKVHPPPPRTDIWEDLVGKKSLLVVYGQKRSRQTFRQLWRESRLLGKVRPLLAVIFLTSLKKSRFRQKRDVSIADNALIPF